MILGFKVLPLNFDQAIEVDINVTLEVLVLSLYNLKDLYVLLNLLRELYIHLFLLFVFICCHILYFIDSKF